MTTPAAIIKVDPHVHISERFPCAVASEEEQILAAIAAGLHAGLFQCQNCSVAAGGAR